MESYLRYQGSQFVSRFDANTYLLMTRALDRYDASAHTNGDMSAAMRNACADFLVISFSSDWRFAPTRSQELVNALLAAEKRVTYSDIESDAGHDAFLLNEPEYIALFDAWMQRVAT